MSRWYNNIKTNIKEIAYKGVRWLNWLRNEDTDK
jgi:hypothetical protein